MPNINHRSEGRERGRLAPPEAQFLRLTLTVEFKGFIITRVMDARNPLCNPHNRDFSTASKWRLPLICLLLLQNDAR